MLQVKGFRAIHYAEGQAGALSDVVTPPYDVISPEERQACFARSPYNYARIILPEATGNVTGYENARKSLESWIADGVMVQDAEESYYLLEQEFSTPDGNARIRRGFFAVTKLPEQGERIVLGHERTFAGPVEDRLRLTEATQANLGPIFVLYSDPQAILRPFLDQAGTRPPDFCATTFEGVQQRLWRVPVDPAVANFFADKRIYIADGHHRFQTACYYRDRMREQDPKPGLKPYDFVLMGFVAFEDPGLVIYPPHRVLDMPENFDREKFRGQMADWFDMEPLDDPNQLVDRVKETAGCAMGVVIHGVGQCLVRLKDSVDRAEMLGTDRGPAWRALDIAVLHRGILENILGLPEGVKLSYERDAQKAVADVLAGTKGMAFIVNATRPEQVRACAEAAEPMPQKATYFFPKLPSGMVIHRLV